MPRKPHKYHYLYKTTNLINNKFYVGMHSTDDLEDGYLGSGTYLRRSIKKYGKEKFKYEILEFFSSREILIEKEKDLVNSDFLKETLCMNLRIGGTGNGTPIGSKRSEETKLKMGAWIRTDEYRKKVSDGNISKRRTAEHKLKYSLAKQGKKHSDESKSNMSIASKGKNKGKKHSDESKLNMSIAHQGKKFSEETKTKMGKSHLLEDWQIKIITDNIGKLSYRKIGKLAECTHSTVNFTIKRLMPEYEHKQGENLLEDWQIKIITEYAGKMSNRKIAVLAKCTHPTVGNTIKRLNK